VSTFGDGRWRFYQDKVPPSEFDRALDELLRAMDGDNAERLTLLAGKLVGQAEFSPEQAADWRQRIRAAREAVTRLPAAT
jgi:hypothetical protein